MKKVIASILTIVLSIPLFLSTPLANTVSQSTVTGYGSYYYTYNNDLDTFILTLGNLGGVSMKGYCQSLIYEFNDTYSGYLDVHLVSQGIWDNATIITENCYVKGRNSTQWDYSIGFKDVTSIKVTIVLPTLTTNNAWSGNKMALTSNYNITRDITSVEDYLEDIETTLGTIDAQLGTMTTSLSNIYGVENASRQLLSEIEYAIRGDNTLYVLSDDMGTIITDLNGIITNVATIHSDLQLIHNDILGANEIGWNNIVNTYQGFTSDFSTYSTTSATYNDGYFVFDPISFSTLIYGADPIIKIQFSTNAYGLNQENYFKPVILTTNNTERDLSNFIIYSYYSRGGITWYLKLDSRLQSFSTSKFAIKITGSKYIYMNNYNRVEYLNHNQDDYYLILNCISNLKNTTFDDTDVINAINSVESAVRNMAVNVNNLTVNATGITYNVNNTQVNNSVTTYNTNINQVYNIENNFGTQLDTQLQNYNPDNTGIISRLTASGNIMAIVLNGINGIELFTVPISVMLVGIVLLAIVG